MPGLEEAALAPMRRFGRGYRASVLILMVLTASGIGAFIYQFSTGIGVTGMNDRVFWGIYTVDLVTFIGFSYGGALVSAILRLTDASWRGPISRLAEGTALATLAVGALFPLASDGHPERVWRLVTAMQIDSPILWDMVAIVTYLIATLVFFTLPVVADLGRLQDASGIEGWRRRWFRAGAFGWSGTAEQHRVLNRSLTTIAILIIPLAVMVHTVLSYAFSLTSRPGWHSTIFGPYFVIAAIYSGVALVVIVIVVFRRVHHLERWIPERAIINLGYLMAALGVLYGYLLFTEITTEGYVGAEASERLLYALLLDRWSVLFWAFVVGALVIPLLIIIYRRTRTVAGVTVSACLVVAAFFIKRFLMFIPPLTEPLVGEEVGAYTPSWVEIVVTVGAVAAIPLLLIGMFKVVPVLAVVEIEEISARRGHRA
jgi:molybdopterin-containing oxidoreductase family membrane subunit